MHPVQGIETYMGKQCTNYDREDKYLLLKQNMGHSKISILQAQRR